MDHVSLTIGNLDRSSKFYEELFGLKVEAEWKREAQGLRARTLKAENNVRLELIEAKNPIPANNSGYKNNFVEIVKHEGFTHISFSVSDMRGTIEKLVKRGGRVIDGPNPGITVKSFAYAEDPDGNVIELVERDKT